MIIIRFLNSVTTGIEQVENSYHIGTAEDDKHLSDCLLHVVSKNVHKSYYHISKALLLPFSLLFTIYLLKCLLSTLS